MPLYGIAHLLSSETAGMLHQAAAEAVKIKNLQFLEDLPLAFIVGYFIPTALMAIPLPSSHLHQWLTGLWQGFPVWVSLAQWILCKVRHYQGQSPPARTQIANRYLLHCAYMFAFGSTSISHIATFATLAARKLFPFLFPPLAQKTLTVSKVFIPPFFRDPGPMESMASGIHNFFQYDQYVGSTAALAWAAAININSKKDRMTFKDWVRLMKELVGVSIVAGPAGALISIMWNRDERLLSDDDLYGKED
ncbi:hypothetical protein N0V90_011214 [Kalmusia sp. IMI 367209]|nr:hypothetical protein N0V90_011214 [Kalmusia sp. IMI 367209]